MRWNKRAPAWWKAPEARRELATLLAEARYQLKMAEVLGYGNKKSYQPLYEQLDQIEAKTAGGKGGKVYRPCRGAASATPLTGSLLQAAKNRDSADVSFLPPLSMTAYRLLH